MPNRGYKKLVTCIIMMIIALAPTLARGQLAILESGFEFENPGFMGSADLMAYDAGRHRLAISDDARDVLYVFDLTDKSYQVIGENINIEGLAGLAYDRAGILHISRKESRAIARVGPDLNEANSIELEGAFDEDFSPGRIAVADDGDLIITDNKHRAICRFDSAGKLINRFTEKLRRPDGIFIQPSGEIFIADKGINPILLFSPKGEYIGNLSRPEDPTQQFSFSTSGLAVDQRGWVYTLDITHNKVVWYDPTGVSREEWAPEQPFFPRDIVIDKYDDVYVSDSGLGRVMVLGVR